MQGKAMVVCLFRYIAALYIPKIREQSIIMRYFPGVHPIRWSRVCVSLQDFKTRTALESQRQEQRVGIEDGSQSTTFFCSTTKFWDA